MIQLPGNLQGFVRPLETTIRETENHQEEGRGGVAYHPGFIAEPETARAGPAGIEKRYPFIQVRQACIETFCEANIGTQNQVTGDPYIVIIPALSQALLSHR